MFNILEETRNIESYIIDSRRSLHQCPELGLNLPSTREFVHKELQSMNIETRLLSSCSGIVGLIEGAGSGKTIALRADMDGLPVKEETGLPFASQNGRMHACGHDAHMAMLLGAAKILASNRDKFKGSVKLLFQPGEEYEGGAFPMIQEGVLENPHVDAVLGQHIGNLFPGPESGQIGIIKGIMMASQDHFYVRVIGKSAHGAYPGNSIDPIVIAANIITTLQTLISREINGTDCAVLTIGKIAAGEAYNIIPGEAYLEGSLRTLGSNIRDRLEERIKQTIRGISETMGGHAEINYIKGYPPLYNDKNFTDTLINSASKIIGRENIIELERPSMASEDVAFFLQNAPGCFFSLTSFKGNSPYPHHNPLFDIDEGVMHKGTAILAQTAVDWLNGN